MSKILLHTPEGVRDIYGAEYARKLKIEAKLKETVKLYGYQDIQTPTFEFFDVFSKEIGTTPSRELYKFFDKEGNTLVLRPDFTPSCARFVAKYYMDESKPIRLTYSGNTFTNTSNLQGKLKEVTQMGAELMMDGSVEADAEMLCLVIEALLNCGLKEFVVAVGDVEYFKGVCAQAGLDEDTELALRDAISAKNYFVAEELLTEKKVRKDYAQVLLRLADTVVSTKDLKEAKSLVDNERSILAVERLEALYDLVAAAGLEKYISFDLGLLSKYNYYTGVLFKAYTYGVGDTIVKGGRYDRLLSRFGKDAAAIGFMVIVDDLLEALDRQDLAPQIKEEGILLLYDKEGYPCALKEAAGLRKQFIPVELMAYDPLKASEYEEHRKVHQQKTIRRVHQDGSVTDFT